MLGTSFTRTRSLMMKNTSNETKSPQRMALHKIIVEPNNILIIIARLGIPKSPKSALLFCIKQKKRETLFGPSDSGVWKYHARMNEETIFSRCKLYMCVQYNMYTMYIIICTPCIYTKRVSVTLSSSSCLKFSRLRTKDKAKTLLFLMSGFLSA